MLAALLATPHSVSRSCCQRKKEGQRGKKKRQKEEREEVLISWRFWPTMKSRSVPFRVWKPAPSDAYRKAEDESQLPGPGEKGGSGPWHAHTPT